MFKIFGFPKKQIRLVEPIQKPQNSVALIESGNSVMLVKSKPGTKSQFLRDEKLGAALFLRQSIGCRLNKNRTFSVRQNGVSILVGFS